MPTGLRSFFSTALKLSLHTSRTTLALRTMRPLIVIYGSTGTGKSDVGACCLLSMASRDGH